MPNQQLAQSFKDLHIPGNPVILYNIWDAGSAQAVASSGAKAIASGSHGVANAFGYEDGEQIPLDLALDNAKRIVATTDLPVTMDFETGYGDSLEEVQSSVQRVIETGVIGINLEDQLLGQSDLRPITEQVDRIKTIRAAAEEAGLPLFINARSDIFKNTDSEQHAAVFDEALVRANAFARAGADGYFVPGLSDIVLIKQLCQQSPLPVNIIRLPGMVSNKALANAGVARISYGPYPYLEMIEWLKKDAKEAFGQ